MRRTVESFGIVHVDQISSTRGLLRTTSSPLDLDILLTRLFLLMGLKRMWNVSLQSDSHVRYTHRVTVGIVDLSVRSEFSNVAS